MPSEIGVDVKTDGRLLAGVGMNKNLLGFRLFSSEGLRPGSIQASQAIHVLVCGPVIPE